MLGLHGDAKVTGHTNQRQWGYTAKFSVMSGLHGKQVREVDYTANKMLGDGRRVGTRFGWIRGLGARGVVRVSTPSGREGKKIAHDSEGQDN